jgi:hypothetical protein
MPAPVSATWTSSGVVVRRRRARRVFEWFAFGVGLACLVVAAVPPLAAAVAAVAFGWNVTLPLGFLLASLLVAQATPRAGKIQLSSDGFVVSGKRRSIALPREAIRSGVIVPYAEDCEVELDVAGGRTISARMTNVDAAERLLAALGVGADRQRSRVALSVEDEGRERALVVLLVAATQVMLMVNGNLGILLSIFSAGLGLPAALMFLSAARSRASATVGLDGIEIQAGRWRRFVPLDDIASSHASKRGIELMRRDGRSKLIDVPGKVSAERFGALALRVDAAIRAREQLRGAPARLPLLERGGRSVPAWRAALRELIRSSADAYRGRTLSPEDVGATLADADAPAEQRLGAALALAASDAPDLRERLRVAAETCANPRIRVALAGIAAAEPDDAAIEEALAEDDAIAAKPRST